MAAKKRKPTRRERKKKPLSEHDQRIILEFADNLCQLQKFNAWLTAQSPHDLANFKALLKLPNAEKIISSSPNAELRNMGLFALSVRRGLLRAGARDIEEVAKEQDDAADPTKTGDSV